jgi:hypothetical protein
MGQLNMLKQNAITVMAYPKDIEGLINISYPQPKEYRSESSGDEEDNVSSSRSGPNNYGSSSGDESSKDCKSESDHDSSCDDPKPKKRSKSKSKSKSTHLKNSKKLKKSKKSKGEESKKNLLLRLSSRRQIR